MITVDALSALPGLAHGFFPRTGGVSEGIFASRNCGFGSGDRRDAVAENRDRCRRDLGPAETLLTVHQVHSPTVVTVTAAWTPETAPQADAMVTDRPGLALGILTADCAPILFADAEAGVIGAAHAGWKGALGGVTDATIAAMRALGAVPERIAAAVGPCIGPEGYEVGPEFRDRFLAEDPDSARFFHMPAATNGKTTRPHFDLPGYVAQRLRRAGLRDVTVTGLDTLAREDQFFSYRRTTLRKEADYGRQISAILLTD
ncbi:MULTISPECIES: peptidoglycan editing factor PgeF [unclassified Inquilinus]|uniref:peptidoglycan editing factor PgeF n=1 Tax=unclassified Inquilinus TaxID=2645927 RepID=UPI003F92E88B